MPIQFSTFIGVEVSPDRTHPFTFAALDEEKAILALSHGKIKDAFAFLAGQSNAIAAINSPMTTNKGLLKREEVRKKLSPSSYLGKWVNLRLVEYELLERGIRIPHTPSTKKKSPRWMKLGFQLFEELDKLGYKLFPNLVSEKQFFECQGEAAFWNLLGHPPLKEGALEGCLQRQVVLYLAGLPVADAMLFFEEITRHRLLNNQLPLDQIYSASELNALIAAYTAFLGATQPDKLINIGDEEEGVIYLPDSSIDGLSHLDLTPKHESV
ncbi:MAG: hypothetical protein J7K66_02440 [Anaerolineaceae bacterium]|nr:hypothetical protein [Anaerolineaceae bacterium]